jgi:hypothetical protein
VPRWYTPSRPAAQLLASIAASQSGGFRRGDADGFYLHRLFIHKAYYNPAAPKRILLKKKYPAANHFRTLVKSEYQGQN